MTTLHKTLTIADPIGFCNGVRCALELFDRIASEHPDEPIYVLHELVHNTTVTTGMKARGAHFVTELSQIPSGALTLFGAHGIGADVEKEASARNLRTFNAVCPLVARLQQLVSQAAPDLPLIFYGDSHHPEVQSILNRAASRDIHLISTPEDAEKLPPCDKALFLSQTTRSADDVSAVAALLKQRIPQLIDHSGICNAVRLRQTAIITLAKQCQAVLIASSAHSANGQRMATLAQHAGNPNVWMIENAGEIDPNRLNSISSLALGAATSTPPSIIQGIVNRLEKLGFTTEQHP